LKRGKLSPEDGLAGAYYLFCKKVIDVVAPLVPAVKPQAAFFEQLGPTGMVVLKEVIDYAASRAGGHPRRQAERHRQHGAGLCRGVSGARRSEPVGLDADRQSYLGDDS
jgi:hypothetical protein